MGVSVDTKEILFGSHVFEVLSYEFIDDGMGLALLIFDHLVEIVGDVWFIGQCFSQIVLKSL